LPASAKLDGCHAHRCDCDIGKPASYCTQQFRYRKILTPHLNFIRHSVQNRSDFMYDNFSQLDCYVSAFECVADDNGVAATAAVSNMLDHLRSISSLWRDVLPTNTYCRAIGGFTLCSIPINILFQSFL